MRTASFLHKARYSLTACIALILLGCASQRAPISPGTVPEQESVGTSDQAYGREVFEGLRSRYGLDFSDARNARVRTVVDRLAEAAKTRPGDWQIYIFNDSTIKNAAATRGNYIFVWTGMLSAVRDDHELATVLAHEMSHILAGHTNPTFQEEFSDFLVDLTGLAARSVMVGQGYISSAAVLAGKASSEAVKAFTINPHSRKLEAEADHIGLFLMAKAGYNPKKAVEFWDRMAYDPAFSGPGLQLLSTHPSSIERMEKLRSHMPEATAIYKTDPISESFETDLPSSKRSDSFEHRYAAKGEEVWIVQVEWAPVFSKPDSTSKVIYYIYYQDPVVVKSTQHRWLEISKPVYGYVKSKDLAPQ